MSTTSKQAIDNDNVIDGAITEIKRPDNSLVIIDPTKFATELFAPYQDQLTAAKRSAARTKYDVATNEGLATAKSVVRSFTKIRTAADEAKSETKRPIDQAGKEILAHFRKLEDAVKAEELKHAKAIADEEARRKAEAERKLAEERARVEAIENRIANIRNVPGRMASASSKDIAAEINQWTVLRLDPSDYQEYLEDALTSVNTTLGQLETLLVDAEQREAAARQAEADRAELARLRAEQDARDKAEREAAAERERIAKAERDRAEADRKAAAQREADLLRQMEEMRRDMAAKLAALQPAPAAAPVEPAPVPAQAGIIGAPLVARGEPIAQGVDMAAPDGDVTGDWLASLPGMADLASTAGDAEEPIVAAPVRPSDREIIDLLAEIYDVSHDTVIGWLKGMAL